MPSGGILAVLEVKLKTLAPADSHVPQSARDHRPSHFRHYYLARRLRSTRSPSLARGFFVGRARLAGQCAAVVIGQEPGVGSRDESTG